MEIRTAEIVCVGTEILIGDIVNTNAAYLSRALAQLGISQYHQSVVGDNPARLAEAVQTALSRADLVLLSGGLGPTYDDLTKETVCRVMGAELTFDEASYARIVSYFTSRNKPMPESNRKQAMVPAGGVVFQNDQGTAPGVGVWDAKREKLAVLLPGPPRELIPMFAQYIKPYIRQFCTKLLYSKNLNIYGMGESLVESILRPVMEQSQNPTLAPYCKEGEVRLRITAACRDEAEGEALCNAMRDQILQTAVGAYVYGENTDLATATVTALQKRHLHVATAESCTGGLLAKSITDIAGASAVFDGGVVTYANAMKERMIGVSAKTLQTDGAVSAQTAREMADGVRCLVGADIGISTTGLAGPGGATPTKPVGLVFIGISTAQKTGAVECRFAGDRAHIRHLAVLRALSMVLAVANGKDVTELSGDTL